ncbi:ABC transporter substrate-binding protein [Sinanaerobacter sp. ZZT-01]|uniref:ABC transporter substrate-binding protein n=1 Tax=Sinanaerobacter sp. ZZT-01 TaxID=3111540 RepID=UPI002D77C31B|nr:ABC transporter substrate-binding protein [Sinanaerobacter sp. ZZT-01]WRR92263.1 ABC transporter substrate-binding protein [Sinanaerobacter sp. ZZT-01]
MKHLKIRKQAALILILSFLLILSSCGANNPKDSSADHLEKITFVLEWSPNTNHTGVYVAQAKGYYEDLGLDVEIVIPPENGASALVASGKAQFGVDVQEGLGTELTLDNPLPITAVASIIDHNTSGLISEKEKGIDDFSKLEGKTYASWDSPTELAIMKQTMTDAGCDYSKLKTVPAPATDSVSLIRSGDVDVVWVYEAWDVISARLANVDFNFIKFSDETPVLDFYTPLIIANNDFLKENPETSKKFMEATAKGYEYAIENPEDAAQILVNAVPELSLDLVTASQQFLAKEYKAEKTKWGSFDEQRWIAFYDWMYEQKLIPSPLGHSGFTNEFLPQ